MVWLLVKLSGLTVSNLSIFIWLVWIKLKVNHIVETGVVIQGTFTLVLLNPAKKVIISNILLFVRNEVLAKELSRHRHLVWVYEWEGFEILKTLAEWKITPSLSVHPLSQRKLCINLLPPHVYSHANLGCTTACSWLVDPRNLCLSPLPLVFHLNFPLLPSCWSGSAMILQWRSRIHQGICWKALSWGSEGSPNLLREACLY